MAVSRPLLIVLVASVLAAVGFYATRGGATPPPPPTPAAPGSSAKPLTPDPSKTATAHPGAKTTKANPKTAAKPKKPDPIHTPAKPKAAAATGVPQRLGSALANHKVVVVLFRQRNGGDDSATAASVASVRGTRGVAVFTDSIRHLDRYPRFLANLGIAQAPSVVVVGPDHQARVFEGYVDSGSLKQQVLDAR